MSTITLNGERVTSAQVTIARYGAIVADVMLASATEIPPSIELAIGNLTIRGTTRRAAAFSGSRTIRFIGGAGGWRKTLRARGYSNLQGVKLSSVIGDAAREAGETLQLDADRVIGTAYSRERAPAERVLHLLAPDQWWVAPDGVTHVGSRPSDPIVTPFTVVKWSGALGRFEIATEAYEDWTPGRTFTGPTVAGVQTISMVQLTADNEGKLRTVVLSGESSSEDRLLESMRSIIRAEIASLTYSGTWDYNVVSSTGEPGISTLIDATPIDARLPAVTKAPLAPGLGIVVPPLAGTPCRIRFANSDPTRPECVGLGAATEHFMTTEATALLIYNVLAALVTLTPGILIGAAIAPTLAVLVNAALAAQGIPAPPGLIAQTIAAAAQAGNFAAGTVASTSAPFNPAIASLTLKTPDVSGLFPGLGVPNG